MNRTGEQGKSPSRKSRVFEVNSYWYYSTREGVTVGPFDSLQEAESGVSHFVDYITHASESSAKSFAAYGALGRDGQRHGEHQRQGLSA